MGPLILLLACALIPADEHAAALDPDLDGVPWPQDCDGTDGAIHPGAEEACNGVDDNCDGQVDEGCAGGELALEEVADATLQSPEPGLQGATTLVLGLPDLNGDGLDELISGHPDVAEAAGEVRASLGANGVLAAPFTTLAGPYPGARFGSALARVESSDCAGGRALAVGSSGYGESGMSSAAHQGAVFLLDPLPEGVGSPGEPLLLGTQAGTQLGFSLVSVGPTEGQWLAAGAPGFGDAGGVLILADPCLGEGEPLPLVGAEDGEAAGSALAVVDPDGDGVPNLAIGAPSATISGALEAGRIYLMERPSEGDQLPDAAGKITGTTKGDRLGAALAAGDLDGDGADDLVVGAPGVGTGGAVLLLPSNVLSAEGNVDAYEATRVEGGLTGLGLGWGIRVGDLTGDDVADLIVSGCPACEDPAVQASGAWILPGPLEDGVVALEAPGVAGGPGWALVQDGPEVGPSLALINEGGLAIGSTWAEAGEPAAWILWDVAALLP